MTLFFFIVLKWLELTLRWTCPHTFASQGFHCKNTFIIKDMLLHTGKSGLKEILFFKISRNTKQDLTVSMPKLFFKIQIKTFYNHKGNKKFTKEEKVPFL